MEIINQPQGSPEWHSERRSSDGTASEAPVMMGASSKMKRDELLAMKKFGTEKEISDYVLNFIFPEGHKTEAMARPIAEKEVEEDLYPVTGKETIEGLVLLASFDGLTMLQDFGWEHKMWNESLAETVRALSLEPEYYWQLEQQILVSNAVKIKFTVSDGTEQNKESMWYFPVKGRAKSLIAGWKQFKKDLETFKEPEDEIQVVAQKTESLPSVFVKVKGEIVITDNLTEFGLSLTKYVKQINHEPETDQDFANLDDAVKTLKKAEEALKAAEENALAQTTSVSEMRRIVADYFELARKNRLAAEKTVKNQKTVVKNRIITDVRTNFKEHLDVLFAELQGMTFSINDGFVEAAKNRRTLSSLRNAVNTELAQRKIEANEIAGLIRGNLNTYKEMASNFEFLFNDLSSIIQSNPDHFKLTVANRIDEHKKAEQKRLDREREQMRIEEECKAQAKADNIYQARINVEKSKESAKPVPTKTGLYSGMVDHGEVAGNSVSNTPPDTQNETKEINKQDFVLPGEWEIINVLARHYGVTTDDVLEWLKDMDFKNLAEAS